LIASLITLFVGVFAVAVSIVIEEEQREMEQLLLRHALSALRDGRKRKFDHAEGHFVTKRRYIEWDRDRAQQCIMDDYLGPVPKFNEDGFKRMFRVSRRNYDMIRAKLCLSDPFFRDSFDARRRRSISIDAKILMALKYISYGAAINAFRDYFQMGESTSRLCVSHFVHGVLSCDDIRNKYFRKMSTADAKRVEKMHYDVHGIRGMAFSLDCSHFFGGKCPIKYHGQYKGKESGPTVVVEAACDYNLWFWHCVFGYVGTMNDINIWDSSMLHQSLHDGTFESNDFVFEIGGQLFDKLWFLTDGIYPELSRFVKTISEPRNRWEALYAIWQEAKRKDVERGFGVIKKKFGFLQIPFQMYDIENIAEIVYCCFILHNMAVEERILSSEDMSESADFYECVENEEVPDVEPAGTMAAMAFIQQENEAFTDRKLEINRLAELGIDIYDPSIAKRAIDVNVLDVSTRLAHQRWKKLYDFTEHKRLQAAIIEELKNKYL
jgi:hypothetical protein